MAENDPTSSAKFWTAGRVIATAVVGALVATIGYTLFSGHRDVSAEPKVVLPGTPVSAGAPKLTPEDFEVPTIDGRTLKLSDYRGKVVVLDFWATWCGPCRQEIPQLVRLSNQNRERGVEVIGLHIDDRGRSTPDAIRRFVDQYNVDYTVGLASDEIFVAYLGSEETAIPQTLVFDRSGKAVAHFVSYSEAHARALEEAINRAIAGS